MISCTFWSNSRGRGYKGHVSKYSEHPLILKFGLSVDRINKKNRFHEKLACRNHFEDMTCQICKNAQKYPKNRCLKMTGKVNIYIFTSHSWRGIIKPVHILTRKRNHVGDCGKCKKKHLSGPFHGWKWYIYELHGCINSPRE